MGGRRERRLAERLCRPQFQRQFRVLRERLLLREFLVVRERFVVVRERFVVLRQFLLTRKARRSPCQAGGGRTVVRPSPRGRPVRPGAGHPAAGPGRTGCQPPEQTAPLRRKAVGCGLGPSLAPTKPNEAVDPPSGASGPAPSGAVTRTCRPVWWNVAFQPEDTD